MPDEKQTTQWLMTIEAEAEVIHGDPDRCTDECRQRCTTEREKRMS